MSQHTALLPETVLRNYLHAKDENRPHWLEGTFTPDAELEILNHASTIAFPAITTGRTAMADVLIRSFGQTYENIYTFYLRRPHGPLAAFSCAWLVAMTEKVNRFVRVGCGQYDWMFADGSGLANRFVITIACMEVLAPSALPEILDWVTGLNYPWSSAGEAIAHMPALPELEPVARHLSAA